MDDLKSALKQREDLLEVSTQRNNWIGGGPIHANVTNSNKVVIVFNIGWYGFSFLFHG